MTINAGGASTAEISQSSKPGNSTRRTVTREGSSKGPKAAAAPLQLIAGAATTGTKPASATMAAKAATPGESIPSSLVTSTRFGLSTRNPFKVVCPLTHQNSPVDQLA